MRILLLSDLYPPHFVGGYELRTHELMEGLRERGHGVRVLTSTYGIPCPRDEGNVRRSLRFRWHPRPPVSDLLRLIPPELEDRETLTDELNTYQPDVVLVANLIGLFRSLPECAADLGARLAYDIADHWFGDFGDGSAIFWNHVPDSRLKQVAKRELRAAFDRRGVPTSPTLPQVENAYFRSQMLRDRCATLGMPVGDCPVIYRGLDTERFGGSDRDYARAGGRLLYVGRLIDNKGVHTLLDACGSLVEKGRQLEVTIVGRGSHDYTTLLRNQIKTLGLSDRAEMIDGLPPEELPRLYADHDLFVFPSIWEEPFGITRIEAMASGMPVVSTTTGGGAEFLRPEENCLAFPPGDSTALADALERLLSDPDLRSAVGRSGRALVRERFGPRRQAEQVEEIESHLQRVVSAN